MSPRWSAKAFAASVEEVSYEALAALCHSEHVTSNQAEFAEIVRDIDQLASSRSANVTTFTKMVETFSDYVSGHAPSTPQSDAGVQSMVNRLDGRDASESPRSGLGRVSSMFFGTPQKRSQLNEERCDEKLMSKWGALAVLVCRFGVMFLREMADAHNTLRWAIGYWEWAEWHPWSHLMNVAMSSVGYTLRLIGGDRARMSQERRAEIYRRMARLKAVEMRVVENIGRVHSALQSMCASLNALAVSVDQYDVDVDGATTLRSINIDVADELRAIVTQAIHNMKLSRSHDALPSLRSAPSFETSGTFQLDETIAVSPVSSWVEVLNSLAKLCSSASLWTESISLQAGRRDAPPRGRHWQRVVKYAAVGLPLARIFLRNTPNSLMKKMFSVVDFSRDLLMWYVVLPSQNMYQSMFAERKAEEYQKQLQIELDSLAQMIRNYHDDYYGDMMTAEELDQISDGVATDNDLGMVATHYQRAVRHPIRSALFGHLIRLMLIQIQEQKIEMNKVLMASEEVLMQNDLTFKMMAMMPLLAFCSISVTVAVYRWRKRSQPVHGLLRRHWRELDRLITMTEADNDPNLDAPTSLTALSFVDQGRVLLLVHQMRSLANEIRDYGYLKEFLEDLDDIERIDISKQQRLRILERMVSVHWFMSSK